MTYKGVAVLRPGEPADELRGYAANSYTGDGMRAPKKWNGGASAASYYYDGDQVLAESDGTGAIDALHTWGADGLVSRRLLGADTYYQWDPSGNCAARLTAAGAVAELLRGGRVRGDGGGCGGGPVRGLRGAVGGVQDNGGGGQDGLMLLWHRLYDPATEGSLPGTPLDITVIPIRHYTFHGLLCLKDSLN